MTDVSDTMTGPRNTRGAGGFTLLEMSIVLAIIATIIAGGAVVFTASLKQRQAEETQKKMVVLQETLLAYWRTYGRIPCPANISGFNTTDGNFAREAAAAGSCDGTPAASFVYNITQDNGIVCDYTVANLSRCIYGGMVPTKTLRLPDEYAFDGWGHRIQYVVDSDFTRTLASEELSDITADVTNGTQRITIDDLDGHPITTIGAYALISHGPNSHGGYPRNVNTVTPVRTSSGSAESHELENCHCTNTATNGTFAIKPGNTLYQSSYSAASLTTTTNQFDDFVVFATRGSLNSAKE